MQMEHPTIAAAATQTKHRMFYCGKKSQERKKDLLSILPVAKNPPVPPKENNFLHIESKTCKAVDRTRRTGANVIGLNRRRLWVQYPDYSTSGICVEVAAILE